MKPKWLTLINKIIQDFPFIIQKEKYSFDTEIL